MPLLLLLLLLLLLALLLLLLLVELPALKDDDDEEEEIEPCVLFAYICLSSKRPSVRPTSALSGQLP